MNDFHCWLPVPSRAQDAVEVAVTTLCVCASNVPKSAASHCRDPKLECPPLPPLLPFCSPLPPHACANCEERIFSNTSNFLHPPRATPLYHIQYIVRSSHSTLPNPLPLPCYHTHSAALPIFSCQFQFHFTISSSSKVSLKFLENVRRHVLPSSLASTTGLPLVGAK